MTANDLPVRYDQWVERTKNLYNGLQILRQTYDPALQWTDQMLDALRYIMFETRDENDWIEMALSQEIDCNHTLTSREKP